MVGRGLRLNILIVLVAILAFAKTTSAQTNPVEEAQTLEAILPLRIEAAKHWQQQNFRQAAGLQEQFVVALERMRPDHPDLVGQKETLAVMKAFADYEHAKALWEAGRYAEAIPLAKRAVAEAESWSLSAPPHLLAEALNELGALFYDIGDFAQSEAYYLRALELTTAMQEAGKLPPAHLEGPHQNIAALYTMMGDYRSAETHLQRALDLCEPEAGCNLVGILNNLGHNSLGKRDFVHAEAQFARAHNILLERGASNDLSFANNLDGLAKVDVHSGRLAQAEQRWKRTLEIQEQELAAEHPNISRTLNNLAAVYLNRGEHKQAEELYERALRQGTKALGADHMQIGIYHFNLASHYASTGVETQALLHLDSFVRIQEDHLRRVLAIGSEQQKQSYLDRAPSGGEGPIYIHLHEMPGSREAARIALMTVLRMKGRSLSAQSDTYRHARQNLNAEGQQLLDRLIALRTTESNLIRSGPGQKDPAKHRANRVEVRKDIDETERSLARLSATFGNQNTPITVKNVAARLPGKTALLEIYQYQPSDMGLPLSEQPPRYAAYLLRPNGRISWADLGPIEPINDQLVAIRSAIQKVEQNPNEPFPREISAALYQNLFGPLDLKFGGIRHLLISPDGLLNQLPFESLITANGQYLVESVQVTYLSTGRDLLQLGVETPHRTGPLVVADPDYDLQRPDGQSADTRFAQPQTRGLYLVEQAHWPRLAGTALEADALRKLMPESRLLTGASATEEALKGVKGPEILHVATHGVYVGDDTALEKGAALEKENPLHRSALILAGANADGTGTEDGYMTAAEAIGLDLWGTKMVVLSACQSGLGEIKSGQGVYGMRRALALAGAQSQVMSLWRVADRGTQELMARFYTHLGKGLGRSEAMRTAKLAMLKGEEFNHPFFWASFTLSGDWRPLDP